MVARGQQDDNAWRETGCVFVDETLAVLDSCEHIPNI